MRTSREARRSAIGLGTVLVLAVVLPALAGGCRKVDLPDGFLCSPSGECPSPYRCYAKKCYRQAPDGGTDHSGSTGDGGRDAHPDRREPVGDGGSTDGFVLNPCDGGSHICGGACVDNNSVAHCGTVCAACDQPTGATATCNGTSCDFTCNDSTQKKCGDKCVSGCCTDQDCPTQNGQVGSCDTSSNSCSYNCAGTNSKACGTACIDPSACCVDSDCTPQTGEVASCNTSTHACGYTCGTGYKACSDATCVLTSGCCTNSDCMAMEGAGQSGTCTLATHTCAFTCTTGTKKCGQLCIGNSACCVDTDCPADGGQIGHCDTSTRVCNYSCTSGQKPCNNVCIPNASCCVASDCTTTAGQAATCGTNGACSYTCANGFKTCAGSTTCVPTSYCCTSTDCAPGAGQNATCTVATGTCSYSCATGNKACGTNACIPNASCCTNADCPPPAGQAGTCNALTGVCQYSCASGFKPCGTNTCIATSACCSSSDCSTPPVSGEVGTCNMATGACSYACGTGFKNCNNTACIASGLCCTSSDCPPVAGATPFCSASNACTYTCNNTFKSCGNGTCVPTTGCCSSTDCAAKPNATATCTSSNICSYTCTTGFTDCGGGTCTNFSAGGCCAAGDCASKTNAIASCNSSQMCTYGCATGLLNCGSGLCVASPGCCTATDCAPRSDATISCNTAHQCIYACNATALKLGCQCSTPGALACNGADMKLSVTCTGGQWVTGMTCSSAQNCDETDGTCHNIVTQCVGQVPGFTFCGPSDTPTTCGPDLTTTTTATPCAGKCLNGVCQTPVCGDGKVEAGEQCDDGNTTPLDGCEPASAPLGAACTKSALLSLALGDSHTCGLFNGGYVRCWGRNDEGQLGLGHAQFEGDNLPYELTVFDASGTPQPAGPINLGGPATAISAGGEFTCAILSDQSVRCWGVNDVGQLGLGNTNTVATLTPNALGPISIGGSASAIAVGETNACVLLTTGSVRCWGDNSSGALGLGNTSTLSTTMVPSQIGTVSLGATATAIAVGTDDSCALLSNGTIRCWGENILGELGLGVKTEVSATMVPSAYGTVLLPSGRTATAISLGSSFTCADLSDGTAECWGYNGSGQLGVGNTTTIGDNESPATAGIVMGPAAGVTRIFAFRGSATCALFANGGGYHCWGDNSEAELGYPDLNERGNTAATLPSNATAVPALTFPTGLSATGLYFGDAHACALLSDGSLHCWGWNNYGQLGLGFVSSAPTDYVGGSSTTTPNTTATAVQVFPPAP
jgi:alpha-tubulin suppressor-like RCC1 family protein